MPKRTIILLVILLGVALVAINYNFRPPKQVELYVEPDGRVELSDRNFDAAQAVAQLTRDYKNPGQITVVIRTSADTPAEDVVPLKSKLEQAGFREVRLVAVNP